MQVILKAVAKPVTFVSGLFVIGQSGYSLWDYASVHETCRVDFSPFFTSEACTPLGAVFQTSAFLIWIWGAVVLLFFLFKNKHK